MSLVANLEFVFLHNARLRGNLFDLFLLKGVSHTSNIIDFDPYSIVIKENNYKISINKKDLLYIVSANGLVDIDYISKTYYQAQSESKIKHQRPSIQDIFLNEARKFKLPTEILLKDNSKVNGFIQGFDNFIIIIGGDNNSQTMVYKHSIIYVYPLEQNFEIIRYAEEDK